MSFVHLHVHSEYSLLDGFSNIRKLVQRAKAMGMPALALTDHGTMFGAIEFYNAATEAGIKPIIGVEAYLAARRMTDRDSKLDKESTHLLLLAENETGYKNLLKIATAAQLEGFYYYPRIDHEFLAAHSEGLICTSGCMSAEIPRALKEGNVEEARRKLDWYYEVFGPDRFYIEMQHHNIDELLEINRQLLQLGKRYQARFVATNDVHYIEREDARLQDILLAIQTGSLLTEPKRMRMTDDTYYLRSPEEMARLFAEVPGALTNTLEIAERCHLDLGFKGYHLPEFPVPEGHTAETYLRQLCEEGLRRKYGARASAPEVRERLEYELRIIHEMGFDAYFLIVWDLCRYAREEGIWYNARGSAAGSIVAYTLDITLVDPLEHGLIFERFLNPGRVSMPDIDLDFRDDLRPKMMEYCARKYGADKVAQIITFGTLGARAAIRDVGRVMDIPLSEVDRVAKLIPNIPGKPVSIEQALEEVPELHELYEKVDYLRELIDTAKKMEGVVRNVGTHAAGVVVADKPIIEYLPLHRPTGHSDDSPIKTVTQFEMNILDALGMLKVDFLGLATLTVMARACEMIKARYGVDLNLHNIPVDDPETYELLGHGATAGVFQVEGAGMRRYLIQMKPQNLNHVIAMIALYRPGPLEFIPSYIRRMHGEEQPTYRHPKLEPIFRETYGIPVYQEQIMFAAMELAGYTASEADSLRKAIAKKKAKQLAKHREKFVNGAVERGIARETAEAIFSDWEEFARYGFNKSHAADYGVIAVQTAYLKAHYPVEYMTALLSVNKDNTDKVALYVADCRRMGIRVLPPSVNRSEWDFTIEDQEDGTSAIRFGLGAVKNVGLKPVDAILRARREGGPFRDLNDFIYRVDLRSVGKRPLECLIKVGALDDFGPRLALLEVLDKMVAISDAHFKAKERGQISMFGEHTGVRDEIRLPVNLPDVSRRELLNWERELIGLYVSDHPLSPVMDAIDEVVTHYAGQLGEAGNRETVRVAGLITAVRPHRTRTDKTMGFVTIEDPQGSIELVVFPRAWETYGPLLAVDNIVLVTGKVDNDGANPKVLVDHVTMELKITDSAGRRPTPPLRRRERVPAPRKPAAPSPAPPPPVEEAIVDAPPPDEDVPPPPEPFPDGWEEAVVPGTAPVAMAAPEPPPVDPVESVEPPTSALSAPVSEALDDSRVAGDTSPRPSVAETRAPYRAAPRLAAPASVETPRRESAPPVFPPRYILPPRTDDENACRMVTVILRATGDRARDNLRVRHVHGILRAYPGRDHFAFYIIEEGRNYLVEFPNDTTGVCDELLQRLAALVGEENIRVETIPIQ